MRAGLIVVLLAGCTSVTSVDGWERRLGVVEPTLSSVQMLELPQQAHAGVPVGGVAHTLGSSSCTQVLNTETEVQGLTAEVRPYDLYAPGDRPCTDDLHSFRHAFTLTFNTPGQAKVVLKGRDFSGAPREYEQFITVLPNSGGAWVRRIGITDVPVSSIPLARIHGDVFAGTPFRVTIRTFGSSSCTRADGEELAMAGNTADVTPYDRYAPAGTACTADISPIEHELTLTFAAPGEAKLRVHGRGQDGRSVTHDVAVIVRRR